MKKLVYSTFIIAGLISYVSADVLLHDSFITGSDPTNGEYGTGNLRDESPQASGGTIVGFSSSNPWDVSTALPTVISGGLSSSAVSGAGGSVSFRGSTDTGDKAAVRQINAYTTPASLYFSGTLSADVIDTDARSFITYSQSDLSNLQLALHVMGNATNPDGYSFDGVAFGFKGDGAGGMDLVIRYRDTDSSYTDTLLVDNVTVDTAYTVAGRIDWNVSGSDDAFIVGVNGTYAGSLTGSLGDGTTIGTVGLVQRLYGTALSDTVTMDELRLASTAEDFGIAIPEPATLGLFAISSTGLILMRRLYNR